VEVPEQRSAGAGATTAGARRCSVTRSGGGCTCRPSVAVRRLRRGGMAAGAKVDGGPPPPSEPPPTPLWWSDGGGDIDVHDSNGDARGRGWRRWHAGGSLGGRVVSATPPSPLPSSGSEVHGVGGKSTTAMSRSSWEVAGGSRCCGGAQAQRACM
jgi:hypothetical protein